MRLTLRHVAVVTTLTLAAACKGDEVNPATTGPDDELRLTLELSSQTDTVPEGSSKQLTARLTDQKGNLQAANITWSSTDPNIASVSNGVITGVALGEASIIAYAKGAADTAQIAVTQNDLLLDVQPSGAMVVLGDTVSFSATVRDRSGQIVAVDSFDWTVSDSAAAKLVGPGSVVMEAEGEITVSAEALARMGGSKVYVYKTPVYSVTITPGTANVTQGQTLWLEATLRDQAGRITKESITWGSSDFSKVKVSQDGKVTGMSVGSAVITATAGGRTGSATINVLGEPATSVNVSFPSTSLPVGSEMQATATPLNADGDALTGKTIAWQSANPSIATVTNTGLVKGIAVGSTNIAAIVDGIIKSTRIDIITRNASSLVIVTKSPTVSIGQQSQLDADVLDQNGNQISGQTITWISSNQSVATVSSTGVLQGMSAGTAVITAVSGTLSATTTATVTSVPTASVRISPTSITLNAGATGTLVAQALDASSNVLSGRVVQWSSANASIATVSNAGLVTAVNAGSTTLTATIEGKSANATVTVNTAPVSGVASIAVQLAHTTLNPTQSTNAYATLKDASGNVVTGTVTWSSLDTAVAKVNPSTGVVTAISGGTVAIIAKSGSVTGSASLTVTTPTVQPVARIEITATTQDLTVGQSIQPTVTIYDAANNVLTGRTITYGTENPSVITVSSTGMVTAMGGGSTRLKVTSSGVSAYETFNVTGTTSTTVASVTVSPATSSLTVGATTQATAVAKDANGATISGTSFAWTTSNAAVASVSSSGLVSAVGTGTATITAAGGGKTGSMSVSVTAASTTTLAKTIQVSLSTSSILVGATAQATAVAKDANGVTLSGKSFTWSVGGSALAQVSSSGLVTGVGAGTVNVSASVDGVTGSASLTITTATSLPPSTTTSPAALPKTFLNYTFPAKTGKTITVAAGGDLQSALNSAARGDEIVLAAGATFTGNFTLPAKAGTAANGWIVVRSEKLSQLPAMGTRVTSAQVSLMPKIVTPNSQPAIKTTAASHGWWMAGLEVTVASSFTGTQYGIIYLGESGSAQNSLTQVPHDLVIDRMYVHGQTTTNTSRCIALNSGRTQITDSYLMECHGKGFDSQAILGWNGPGPYKIVNNTLQGAGENIMFGGSDPSIPNLVPSDIEIRRNYIYTPASWKGVWTKKNLLELKNSARVLIEANIMEGSWIDGQTGWAVLLRSTNQGGGCRWCRTTDVTMRKNYITNVGAGVNFIGSGANSPTDSVSRRLFVSELVIDNIGANGFTGDLRAIQFIGGPEDVTLERTVATGSLNMLGWLDKSITSKRVTFRDNVLARGNAGLAADATTQGKPSLDVAMPGWTWTNMTLIGTSVTSYPTGTTFVSSEGQASLAAQIRTSIQSAVAGVRIP